jgi:predicted transcriptional regulator
MKPLALSPAEQQRLEKLARDAGRSPRAMMRFVLRDGFEYSEWQVRESLAAKAEAGRHGTVPNDLVMREARERIEAARGRRRRKAA